MASQLDITRGLQVLNSYKLADDPWDCDIYDDSVYASGPNIKDISTEHLEELKNLGWSYEDKFDCWKFDM